jgi:hypothetical protein
MAKKNTTRLELAITPADATPTKSKKAEVNAVPKPKRMSAIDAAAKVLAAAQSRSPVPGRSSTRSRCSVGACWPRRSMPTPSRFCSRALTG